MIKVLSLVSVVVALFVSSPAMAAADKPGMDHGHNMVDSGRPYSDRAYLSAMIAHHQAAIEMAEVVKKSGQDRSVRKWADDVVDTQRKEIDDMRKMLKDLGGEDAQAADMMRRDMQAMVAAGTDPNADRNFISMMIGHHAGAVYMATEAMVRSTDEKVIKLSRDIVREQAKEIAEYKEWLHKH